MTTRSTLTIVVIALVVLVAVWFLSSMFIRQFQLNSNQAKNNAPDTTENISSDLNKIPSDATVDSSMNALDKDLQSF